MAQGFDAYARYQTLDDAVALAGAVSFGWVKATDGSPFVAVSLADWFSRFSGTSIALGPYHFAQPAMSTPESQADYFCDNAVEAFPWRLAPALDIESQGADLPGFVTRWIARMRARGHQKLVVYSYTSMLRDQLGVDSWADPDVFLWVADPNSPPGQPSWTHPQARAHQYGQGPLPGISGSTDLNTSLGDVTDLYLDTPAPAPQQQQEDDMASATVTSLPPGTTVDTTIAVAPVRASVVTGPNGKAWFALVAGADAATVHSVRGYAGNDGNPDTPTTTPLDVPESTLNARDRAEWELPDGVTAVVVNYTSTQQMSALTQYLYGA